MGKCFNCKEGKICSYENDLKKVELINTLHYKVIAYDADGENCYYVIVPLDGETIDVLKKLGATNAEIMGDARADQYHNHRIVIDLAPYGFQFAKWWYQDKGFSLNKRSE